MCACGRSDGAVGAGAASRYPGRLRKRCRNAFRKIHRTRARYVDALEYLLKPIDSDRFVEAVKRGQRQIKLHLAGEIEDRLNRLLTDRYPYVRRFAIRTGSRIVFVLADEIDWIEATGDYATLHVGKRTLLLRETFNSLEKRLDPEKFIRIHRSTIVKAFRIRELQTMPNRELRLRLIDGTTLKVSRTYREHFDRWLSRESPPATLFRLAGHDS